LAIALALVSIEKYRPRNMIHAAIEALSINLQSPVFSWGDSSLVCKE
jgi:hypothetical protein